MPLRDPATFRYIRQPVPRLDVRDKSTGRAIYAIDQKVEGMLYAAVQHAARLGTEPKALANEVEVKGMPGVHSVHRLGEHGPGALIGEINSLSGRPALVAARAEDAGTLALLSPEQARSLIIAEAVLGERIMRALILRRVRLIERGAGGPLLVAPAGHPGRVALAGFLRRNGLPFTELDPARDALAQDLAYALDAPHKLPLVVLADGTPLMAPTEVELARHAAHVRMMVRAPGLSATMSRYLIDRIAADPRISLMTRTEVIGLDGGAAGLESVTWRDRASGRDTVAAIRNLFLFIGAEPATEWLSGCGVPTDKNGFARTLPDRHATDRPGVFAIGDVRAGSVKRVGGAIGEGAAVVAEIHAYLGASGAMPAD